MQYIFTNYTTNQISVSEYKQKKAYGDLPDHENTGCLVA